MLAFVTRAFSSFDLSLGVGLLCGAILGGLGWWHGGDIARFFVGSLTVSPASIPSLGWDEHGLLWPVQPREETVFWLRTDTEGTPLSASCQYSLTLPLGKNRLATGPSLPEPWWLASGEAPHLQPRFLLGSVQRFEMMAAERDHSLEVIVSAFPSAGVWLPLPARSPVLALLVETPQAEALQRVERLFQPALRRLACH
jgi:hypothetical protein